MVIRKKDKPQVYVLYSFIDRDAAEKTGRACTGDLDLRTKYEASTNLLALALKKYYGIELPDGKRPKDGFVGGVYFCFSLSYCAIAVAVSEIPIGIDVQITFPVDEEEYVKDNFSPGELDEYRRRALGPDTFYCVLGKKRALRKKTSSEAPTLELDSTLYDSYTVFKTDFDFRKYVFVSTDLAEFAPVDINAVLPQK